MMQTLRDYQLDMIERLKQRCREGHRIIVAQAPTGSGKTTIASEIARRASARGRQTLFLVHRRKLVDQISARLRDHCVDHGVLMRGEHYEPGHNVTVASRDTLLSRSVRNQWVGMPPAQLVIVDEAHHAADAQSEYRRILSAYPQSTVLLLTATPVGPDGAGLGPWATAMECAAPTSRLVSEGHLCPVKVYAPERHHEGARGLAGDLVDSWRQYAGGAPTVLFTSRVQHSKDAVEAFREAGIPAAHLDANTPDDCPFCALDPRGSDCSCRDKTYDDIRTGKILVLSNVGIVGEGVDVPELGCCQLYCEISGRTAWMQRIGRVMRPAPGKTHGIVIDHSGAVFRHGFPDEDFTWTLDGENDAEWKKKKEAGDTEATNYCPHCELVYPRAAVCPQCGRGHTKPPPSIFLPPVDVDPSIDLTEAERRQIASMYSVEEMRLHWLRCQAIGAKRGGGDRQAAAIWRKKYGRYPDRAITQAGTQDRVPQTA